MSLDAIKAYLAAIEQALKTGNTTGHTHRPALKTLLESIAARLLPAGLVLPGDGKASRH